MSMKGLQDDCRMSMKGPQNDCRMIMKGMQNDCGMTNLLREIVDGPVLMRKSSPEIL